MNGEQIEYCGPVCDGHPVDRACATMSGYSDGDGFGRIMAHIGHELQAAYWSKRVDIPTLEGDLVRNAAVVCEDCGEIVFDYDNPNVKGA